MTRHRIRTAARLCAAPAALTVALAGCGSVPDSEVVDAPVATTEDAAPSTEADAPTTEDADPTTQDAAPTTAEPAPVDPTEEETEDGAEDDAATTSGGPGGGQASGENGTLEDPLPLGSTVEVGDWTVTIDDFEADASADLSTPEAGNPEPPDGSQYSLLSVTATYHGAETGSAFMDLWFELLGPDGMPTSDTEGEFCYAGTEDLIAAPPSSAGDTVSGQVCFIVANDDIDTSVLLVEELFTMNHDGSYYVALD